jgi:hypothetical protein
MAVMSSSTVPMGLISNFLTKTLTTVGERKAGRVGNGGKQALGHKFLFLGYGLDFRVI